MPGLICAKEDATVKRQTRSILYRMHEWDAIKEDFIKTKVTPYFSNHYIAGSGSCKFNLDLILEDTFDGG